MGTVSELVEELHALALSEQGRGDLAAASVIHMIAGLVAERLGHLDPPTHLEETPCPSTPQ